MDAVEKRKSLDPARTPITWSFQPVAYFLYTLSCSDPVAGKWALYAVPKTLLVLDYGTFVLIPIFECTSIGYVGIKVGVTFEN
jgi:hypothetical protein